MRTVQTATILCALMAGLPAIGSAQGRMPHEDAAAVGGGVGIFLPKQDGMNTGPALEGFYEYYVGARDSLRVGVGWANPKFERESADSVRQIRVGVDVLHNWEGGAVHPFIGAGLGTYFLQVKDNGENFGDSQTKFGGTLIGGIEYFTSDTFAVKGEARYHVVMKANGYDPSGLALTIGVKSYF
jgi:opacity protein-like surface antigen